MLAPARGDFHSARGAPHLLARAQLGHPGGVSWQEAFFGAAYPRLYHGSAELGLVRREARAVAQLLGVSAPARLLDLGCGFGRHTLALAEAGLHTIGVDRSDPLLTLARRDARRRGLERGCDFVRADFCALGPRELGGQVDGALCLFGTLGLDTKARDLEALVAAGTCLAPGARLLIELPNPARLPALDGRRSWSEHEDEGERWYVLERYTFDGHARRLSGERLLVSKDAPVARFPFELHAYGQAELRTLLSEAGLRTLATYGDLSRAPLSADSPGMVFVCERPGS